VLGKRGERAFTMLIAGVILFLRRTVAVETRQMYYYSVVSKISGKLIQMVFIL